jgi:ADP-heptose:LPS heptosyltransferase
MDPGDFDLAELRALIDRAALFVGGDSGPLHVASTTRTPIVGLFGPTLAARSAPWRDPRWIAESIELADLACRPCDQRHCVTHDYRCLGNITVEMVAAAAERVLARRCEAIATRDLEPATTDQGDSSPDPRSLIPDPLSE